MIKQGINSIKLAGINVAFINGDLVYYSIPNEYTEKQYIHSSGNSYFTTNLYLTSESEIISYIEFSNSSGNVYGCYSGQSGNDNFTYYGGSRSADGYFRYGSQLKRVFRPESGTKYKIVHNKTGIYINDQLVSSGFESTDFICTEALAIGTLANSSAAGFTGSIYRLTVKTNGQVVMDLIPVQDTNQNYGLYDVIGRVFYQSSGAAFTGA